MGASGQPDITASCSDARDCRAMRKITSIFRVATQEAVISDDEPVLVRVINSGEKGRMAEVYARIKDTNGHALPCAEIGSERKLHMRVRPVGPSPAQAPLA